MIVYICIYVKEVGLYMYVSLFLLCVIMMIMSDYCDVIKYDFCFF